jgi:hypothetical protein
MAINWRQEADNIINTSNNVINTSELFGNLQRITDTSKILETESYETNLAKFDGSKVVMWVKADQQNTNIVAGLKVIRLVPIDEIYVKILFWNGNDYEFAVIEDNLLSNEPLLDEKNAIKIFLNDSSHIQARIKNFNILTMGINPYFNINKFNVFNKTVSDLTTKLKWIESAVYSDILMLYDTFNNKFEVNTANKVETLENFTNTIFSIFNPELFNSTTNRLKNYQKNTLFVPLSEDWFNSDPALAAHYKGKWLTNGSLSRFAGGSGEGIYVEDDVNTMKLALLNLKKIVIESSVRNTPEGTWIEKLTNNDLSEITRMIFVHNDTWRYDKNNRYAEGIGLMTGTSFFQPPPLLTVLLHEMNVNSNDMHNDNMPFFPRSDTHTSIDNTQASWEKASNPNLFKKAIVEDVDFIDNLYQAANHISTLILAIILSLK